MMKSFRGRLLTLILTIISSKAIFAATLKNVQNSDGRNDQLAQQFNMVEVKDSKVIEFFKKLLPSTSFEKIYTTPYKNMYVLQAGKSIFYGQVGSPFLMVGHLFNPYTQQDITNNVDDIRLANTKIDISKINIENAIISKGKDNPKNKKLYIFEDPDCPYCRVLEQQFQATALESKVEIIRFLIPLPMHENAKKHIENIYCAKYQDKEKVLYEYMIKNNDSKKIELRNECSVEKVIEQNAEIAKSLNITGTPTIILGNGRLLIGADINGIMDYINTTEPLIKFESSTK